MCFCFLVCLSSVALQDGVFSALGGSCFCSSEVVWLTVVFRLRFALLLARVPLLLFVFGQFQVLVSV
jgi:hypothetical protein